MGKKINNVLKINLYLIVLGLIASCNSTITSSNEKKHKKIYYIKESNKNLISNIGDTLFIVVKSNSSSGYLKNLVDDKECNKLRFISKKFISLGDDKCEGCGGYEEYKFISKKSGECFVKIATISMRSENKDTISIDSYKVSIH